MALNHFRASHFGAKHFAPEHFGVRDVEEAVGGVGRRRDSSNALASRRSRIIKHLISEEDELVIILARSIGGINGNT